MYSRGRPDPALVSSPAAPRNRRATLLQSVLAVLALSFSHVLTRSTIVLASLDRKRRLKQIKLHVVRVRTCQSRWITAMKPCCRGGAERLRGGVSEGASSELGRPRVYMWKGWNRKK
ncbi:hypothetical protein Y032_0081g1472 [Ancylostoma ceylanicum]|uniref:Uncharacterized protein n=1 Tax=Ancylostoma ceylanicum TaxID=53326 RepID=A0A016TRG0_9BILA|nr:hypothetical protein Y032_0081g1472 [Ancylostoma ceylanicum]